MEMLSSLKKGQESLKKTFDSKIEKLRKYILSTIDDKIKSVKVDIDLQFAAIENRISHVESEIISIKEQSGQNV